MTFGERDRDLVWDDDDDDDDDDADEGEEAENNLSNNASSSSIPVTDCKPVIMILLASSEVGILSLTNCL